jgi:O-antigen/teichoic acid export membrane protein
MPALVFVAFCGRSLLGLLYGPRYTAAVGPLIAASFVALLNAMNGQVTIVYYAKGMPQLHRRCVLITAATMIVLTYPFVLKFGLVGGQLAALVAISAGFLFQVVRLRDLTTLDPMRYVKVFAVFGAISAVIAGVCLSVRTVAAVSQPVPNILVGAGACTIAGGLGLFAFFRNVAGEIW